MFKIKISEVQRQMLLNISTFVFLPLISGVINLFKAKFFISSLGDDGNGIYQFYVQFFSYFTFLELGLETAVCSTLFSGLVNKDYDKVNSIIKGAKIYWNRLGFLNLILGSILLPLAPIMIKSSFPAIYIVIIQAIYVLKSTFNCFFAGPQVVTLADNKGYRVITLDSLSIAITSITTIVIVYFTQSLLLVAIFECIAALIFVIIKSKYLKLKFSWLDWKKIKVPSFDFKNLFKGTLIIKGTELLITNTDVVVTMLVLGATASSNFSIYNNFSVLLVSILGTSLISTMQSFLGKKFVEKDMNENDKTEHIILLKLLNALILVIMVPLIALAINSFIRFFYGASHVEEGIFYICYIAYIYFRLFRTPYNTLKVSLGNYNRFTVSAIADAVLKVVLAFVLSMFFGLTGILLSTIISYLLTEFLYEIKVFDQEILGVPVWKTLAKTMLHFVFVLVLSYGIYFFFSSFITNFISFVIVCFIVFVVLFMVVIGGFYLLSPKFKKMIQSFR